MSIHASTIGNNQSDLFFCMKPVQRPSRPNSPNLNFRVTKNLIEPVLSHPERVRNVCILAHVDHGKTTLTDSLLASNGIISFKQAGKLRYMDSREDEQERGITMQASAITLLYDFCPQKGASPQRHAINVIDSPGHVDFARQVVSAARLADGCLLLVDVVEGVCAQTLSVIRQAKREKLTPILVLNKIDRLVCELRLSSTDAFDWLRRILEQVNAAHSTAITEEGCESNSNVFDPLLGNVIFASSTDGWACDIDFFAELFSSKVGLPLNELKKYMWGDYYFDPKSKTFAKKGQDSHSASKKTAFSLFVIDSIWKIYESALIEWNQEKIENIIRQLGLDISIKDLKGKDSALRSILSKWLSLSDTIFTSIIRNIPPAMESNHERLYYLTHSSKELALASHINGLTLNSISVAYISKFFAVYTRDIMVKNPSLHVESNENYKVKLIGMGRVFSGSLKIGDTVFLVNSEEQKQETIIKELYILMGRDLEPVEEVHCGSIFGIGGLSHLLKKCGTISSSADFTPIPKPRTDITPIVNVAVSPLNIEHISRVIDGLKLVCQADPCAETFMNNETGEAILSAAGELHLEQLIKDLRDMYLDDGVEISTSRPMVPYRETISDEKGRNEDLWRRVIEGEFNLISSNQGNIVSSPDCISFELGLQTFPLNEETLNFFSLNKATIKIICQSGNHSSSTVAEELNHLLLKNFSFNDDSAINLLSLGPHWDGLNVLISCVDSDKMSNDLKKLYQNVCDLLITAFQLFTEKGPLANEPLHGVAFVITSFSPSNEGSLEYSYNIAHLLPYCQAALESSFLYWSPRLMLAFYKCTIHTSPDLLGKVYASLSKRHAKIISEEFDEGTGLFSVFSHLPVAESFGFADELRSKTSGMAMPQLEFQGFETLEEDPYWIPLTEEEQDNDEICENLAQKHVQIIRERKGLFVERKITTFAEKQRTLRR